MEALGIKHRVVLIGPVLPFRGGIAQHTTMLHRAMRQYADVLTISFTRQYPAWLFPGESNRDPEYAGHEEGGVEYLIDSINPITWIKTVKRIHAFQPQVVIIPWWTIYWAPCFGALAGAVRSNGIDIVFFCHNVVEHESASWKQWATRRVLCNANRYVVHTREDENNLKQLLPGVKVAVHPHPIYDQFPPPGHILPRRRALELLFYGFVRPYKGLDILIEAMGQLKGKDIQLTVAGEFWADEQKIRTRVTELGIEEQVDIRPRYHSDQETAQLFTRADVVVLPYRSATGSGVVPVAYHYNRPVIVARVGGLADVVRNDETGKVVEPENVDALAHAIDSMTREQAEAMLPAIVTLKQTMTWASLAATFL